MKFMLNGALTLEQWTVQRRIVEEVAKENAFIFGLSSDEVSTMKTTADTIQT